jgi:hypothetical protein
MPDGASAHQHLPKELNTALGRNRDTNPHLSLRADPFANASHLADNHFRDLPVVASSRAIFLSWSTLA